MDKLWAGAAAALTCIAVCCCGRRAICQLSAKSQNGYCFGCVWGVSGEGDRIHLVPNLHAGAGRRHDGDIWCAWVLLVELVAEVGYA